MSTKRFGNFQLKQPSSLYKKPKLDIDIISSQQYATQTATSKGPTKAVPKTAKKSDYLWGDEDDEFIILASQAVEEVEMFQQTQSQTVHGTVADITFGKFTNVSSSTQLLAAPGPSNINAPERGFASSKPQGNCRELVDEFFQDGDDDIFSEQFDDNYEQIASKINDYFEDEQRKDCENAAADCNLNGTVKHEMNGFKVPTLPAGPSNMTKRATSASQSASRARAEQEAKQMAAKQKDHAKDIQLQFLTDQLELAGKKTDKLQIDYNEIVEKMQIKDAELYTLRYHMKSVKAANDEYLVQKVRESEKTQKEWIEKVKDLEKVILAQKTDLEFKEVEMMNLRSKRLNSSVRNELLVTAAPPVTEDSFVIFRRSFPSHDGKAIPAHDFTTNQSIFEISGESISKFNINNKLSNFTKRDALMSKYLGQLQTCLSTILSRRVRSELPDELLAVCCDATDGAIDEIEQYCRHLPAYHVKDVHLSATAAYDFLCRNLKTSRLEQGQTNIFQQEALFPGEQAIVIRRFIGALGLLCRLGSRLVQHLFQTKRIASFVKSLHRLSYAIALYDHHGMVAATATFLRSLIVHPSIIATYGSELLQLFRAIVFCRSDSSAAINDLSAFLHQLSSAPEAIEFLKLLCHRSPADSFTSNHSTETIQFKKDSCTLQVYAALLETSVPQFLHPDRWQLEYLTANVLNTIYFLRNVITSAVGWVQEFVCMPNQTCSCFVKMVNSFIVTLHQLLRHWMDRPLDIEYRTMLKITQNGTLLLFDLFQTTYRKDILQIGGHRIQCRLRAIYDWLVLHQTDFKFEPAHRKSLQLLDLRLLMYEPLKTNDDEEKMDTDGNPADGSSKQPPAKLSDDMFEHFFSSKFRSP